MRGRKHASGHVFISDCAVVKRKEREERERRTYTQSRLSSHSTPAVSPHTRAHYKGNQSCAPEMGGPSWRALPCGMRRRPRTYLLCLWCQLFLRTNLATLFQFRSKAPGTICLTLSALPKLNKRISRTKFYVPQE